MSPSSSSAAHEGTATTAVISLGSNLGARERSVLQGARAVATIDGVGAARLSSLYETEPVGAGYSRPFVNAVVVLEAWIDPMALLEACLGIERAAGRKPGGGDRLLDIDIVLFGDLRSQAPRLVLPHPRMRERLFVLAPLAELAPGMRLPPDGVTTAEAAARLGNSPGVRRISSRSIVAARAFPPVRD